MADHRLMPEGGRKTGPPFPGNFTIGNNLMFGHVMRDPDICRGIIERILGVEVGKIAYHETQKEMIGELLAKGVRLDVYVEGTGAVYDVEMQATRELALGRRCRYYQAMIDTGLLRRGGVYGDLTCSFIIFVCTYDPLGAGLPVYTVEPACLERGGLDVGSGMRWVLLNAPAWRAEANPGLRRLLEYVHEGTVPDGDELIGDIDRAVHDANNDEGLVRDMWWSVNTVEGNAEMRGYMYGREDGLAEGEARHNALVAKLAAEGRIDELVDASQDAEALAALLAELDRD